MSTQEGRAVAAAFRDGVSCWRARTTTDGQVVLLFGNRIAWRDDKGMVWLTLCGWPGPTTRDRLNAITVALGVDEGFSKQKDVSFFGGRKIGDWEHIPMCGPLGALALAVERGEKIHA